ncbi:urease accessory protein [Aliiruegeria haliotis]|uniref:Urease accessory protein UreE n=1 Tax=Aliiruegeria haliotis TaxID=1280846 RepID=A0A2T0RVN3_9RHOB|nr:urease accessory protein UreE [Aliiruegeria haliotis]PRY25210.1 urease accessory protein [Aliiruegeria haliotis]
MKDFGRAVSVDRQTTAGAVDRVRLDYDGRFLRRKRLATAGGGSVVVDLAETTSLDDGDALVLEDGGRIAVEAAAEPLLEIRGENLVRLAWHIGNRHTPCRIEADRLLIRDDHVLADMVRKLGGVVAPVSAPFSPEGGAYGHGRTMGHDHGPDHTHAHSDDHAHE